MAFNKAPSAWLGQTYAVGTNAVSIKTGTGPHWAVEAEAVAACSAGWLND